MVEFRPHCVDNPHTLALGHALGPTWHTVVVGETCAPAQVRVRAIEARVESIYFPGGNAQSCNLHTHMRCREKSRFGQTHAEVNIIHGEHGNGLRCAV